jgi:hypothetical protein
MIIFNKTRMQTSGGAHKKIVLSRAMKFISPSLCFVFYTLRVLIVMQPPMFTQYRTAAGEIFYSFLFRTVMRPLSAHCLLILI